MKRTIEITIETEQVLQIYSRGNQQGWCRDCGCETDMATIDVTHFGTGWNPETMCKHLQGQGWHTSLARDGRTLWVCLTSRPEPTEVEKAVRRLIGKPPDQPE